MSKIQERASLQLPAVLLTLISIIQAIALDMLWSKFMANAYVDQLSMVAITGWLQSFTTLLMLIVVWMTFVGLLMRFVWTPALSDTALPFIVGLLQFAVIEACTPSRFGYWLIGLAILSLVVSVLTQRYFKRARLNPRNAEFFQMVSPATWRDFMPSFLSAAYAFATGALVLGVSLAAWMHNLIILPIIVGLAYYIYDQNRYWVISIPSTSKTANEASTQSEQS